MRLWFSYVCITKQPALFWGLIASMWLGNLMLVILNLPLIGIWVRLLQVPYGYLFPTILILCCIGTYTLNSSTGDVIVMTVFGVIGYAFRKLDCEPAPLLLGLVLGPMLEENFRRAMVLSDGDWLIFVQRPISLGFLLLATALLLAVALPNIRRTREQAFLESSGFRSDQRVPRQSADGGQAQLLQLRCRNSHVPGRRWAGSLETHAVMTRNSARAGE